MYMYIPMLVYHALLFLWMTSTSANWTTLTCLLCVVTSKGWQVVSRYYFTSAWEGPDEAG